MSANRIAPKLWMGSYPRDGSRLAKDGVSLLVLCAEELQTINAPGVKVLRCPLNDDGTPLSDADWRRARKAGRAVAEHIGRGGRALVTCAQGINRSGLVTALALRDLYNWTGMRCVQQVRANRNVPPPIGQALVNPYFLAKLATLGAA